MLSLCFSALRQIRSLRWALPQHALLTLVQTLLITRLDQCNSVLAGISGYLQDQLQSVLNAAAHLVYSCRTLEHTTPLLRELHWLRIPERIQFWLCILAYHCVHGTAPAYLTESLRLTSEIIALSTHRCCWCHKFVGQTSVTTCFLWLPHGRGTICHQRPGPPPQYWHSDERLSPIFRQSFGWQKSGTVSCWLIVHCHWDKSHETFYW